jgi:hypothetical protein
MKYNQLKFFPHLLLIISLLSFVNVYAEESSSSNYKLTGVLISTAGEESESNDGSGNLRMFSSVGEVTSDERFLSSSGLYAQLPGSPNVLVANVPLIKCFETQSSGYTNCTRVDINPDGMEMLCGGGCYDRARFEIDPQENPEDTLYTIQIKLTSESSWSHIDPGTFLPKSSSSLSISDFQTKFFWENSISAFNVMGLAPGSEYEIRAQALHGDFTLSEFGPSKIAVSAYPSIVFDIDIAGVDGEESESHVSYFVDFGVLAPFTVQTARDLIWFDLTSNSYNGTNVYMKGENGGLLSLNTSQIIVSETADLDLVTKGFGVVGNSSDQKYLGPLSITPFYEDSISNVGVISTSVSLIYNTSSNPIKDARASMLLRAKTDASLAASDDYREVITFLLISFF